MSSYIYGLTIDPNGPLYLIYASMEGKRNDGPYTAAQLAAALRQGAIDPWSLCSNNPQNGSDAWQGEPVGRVVAAAYAPFVHRLRHLVATTFDLISSILIIAYMIAGSIALFMLLWPVISAVSGYGESHDVVLEQWVNNLGKPFGILILAAFAFGLSRSIRWLVENVITPPEGFYDRASAASNED